jgi:hypothetical protein
MGTGSPTVVLETGIGVDSSEWGPVASIIARSNAVFRYDRAKKQQMQWTKKGAHLVLQMRTQVLDERLEETFRRWYPDFRPAENRAPKAA